jgi:hypothetical protein
MRDKHESKSNAKLDDKGFETAVAELDELIKSRDSATKSDLDKVGEGLMARGNSMLNKAKSSVGRMSDDKDYMEENLDDSDRKPQAKKRKDMEESNEEWPGIEAMDAELDDADGLDEDGDEEHEMIVSGRPSKIRFPGAKGDSELRPVQDVVDIPDRAGYERAGGGDHASMRSQRRESMKSRRHEHEPKREAEEFEDDEEYSEKSLAHHRRAALSHRHLAHAHLKRARHHHEAGNMDKAMHHERAAEHHDALADRHETAAREMGKSRGYEQEIFKSLAENSDFENVVEASDALAHMTDVFAKSHAALRGEIDDIHAAVRDIRGAVAQLCRSQGEILKSFGKVPVRMNDSGVFGKVNQEFVYGNRRAYDASSNDADKGQSKLPEKPIIKGSQEYELIKSKLQEAMVDGNIDPDILLVYDSVDPRSPDATGNVMRALTRIPTDIKKQYGLPDWGYMN